MLATEKTPGGRVMTFVLYRRDLTTDVPPERELRDIVLNTFSPRKLYAEPKLST